MEEYYKPSDQFTSQYNPRNTSKCTGNISKNTSTFTGETNQIRSGGPSGPGLQGSTNSRWACSSLCCSSSTYLGFGPWPKELYPKRPFVRLWETKRKTTATPLRLSPISPTFLGWVLGVLSGDLATTLILPTNLIWLVVLVHSPVFLLISPAHYYYSGIGLHVILSLYIHNLPWCYYNLHVIFFRGSSFRGITRLKE